MKRIIRGKRYNTEAPHTVRVATISSECYADDLAHWLETLYRTGHGRWFLVGEGGPQSRYARSTDVNNWSGGSKLMPMDQGAAQRWLEDCRTDEATAALEAYFGSEVEDA